MSEFLDGLARTLAQPMPRRRALQIVTGALIGAVLPGRSGAKAYAANASRCPHPGDLYCGGCPSVNGKFFGAVCCPGPAAEKYWECTCKPGPGGYGGCK